ncbi:MAG: hypothetical protein ACRDTH_07675 [Pseudonocardiaceae bacterium]
MSASHTHESRLLPEVEALTAAIMADAPLSEIIPITERLKVAMDRWDEIPAVAISELRSAIDLMYGGRACATINALLAARSELSTPPR